MPFLVYAFEAKGTSTLSARIGKETEISSFIPLEINCISNTATTTLHEDNFKPLARVRLASFDDLPLGCEIGQAVRNTDKEALGRADLKEPSLGGSITVRYTLTWWSSILSLLLLYIFIAMPIWNLAVIKAFKAAYSSVYNSSGLENDSDRIGS